jgi:hypothetical protein
MRRIAADPQITRVVGDFRAEAKARGLRRMKVSIIHCDRCGAVITEGGSIVAPRAGELSRRFDHELDLCPKSPVNPPPLAVRIDKVLPSRA